MQKSQLFIVKNICNIKYIHNGGLTVVEPVDHAEEDEDGREEDAATCKIKILTDKWNNKTYSD